MAYSKKTWQDAEVITKEALNNMEGGIEAAALKTDLDAKAKKVAGAVNVDSVKEAAAAQPTQAEFKAVVDAIKALATKVNAMNA